MLTLAELNNLTKEYNFPDEAREFFSEAGKKVLDRADAKEQFALALDACIHCNDDFGRVKPYIDKLSAVAAVGYRPAEMLFRLMTADDLIKIYTDAGVSREIAEDTVSANIVCELEECRRLYGEWGSFSFWFHVRQYERKLCKLGRLQFETTENPDEIFCHIIAFLPFTMDLIQDSLRQAYSFYGFDKKNRPMKVRMDSWILHPAFKEIFKSGSNLKAFSEMFTVTGYRDTDSELFYIFSKPSGTPISEFPEDTELQRNCKKYLLSGKILGEGYGYLLYDGRGVIKTNACQKR